MDSNFDLLFSCSEYHKNNHKMCLIYRCLTEIRQYNGLNYKFHKNFNIWKKTCCYEEECYNFTVKDSNFCKKHENGTYKKEQSTNEIGNIAEKFLYNLLIQSDQLTNVKMIGQENCNLDLIYQVKDEFNKGINIYRGLQVKTLTKNIKQKNYYQAKIGSYDDNTLIIGLDKKFKYICIIFKKNIKGGSIKINFNKIDNEIIKYVHKIEDNLFYNELICACKKSTVYNENQYSNDNLKEKYMMEILKHKCLENNIEFKANKISFSPIDCFINKKSIQCKYSSVIKDNSCQFRLNHTVNNKLNVPYSEENKIDFFIFSYCNVCFWIIPIQVLIYYGYIKNNSQKGKISIMLAYNKNLDHWTKKFIVNNFDIIINGFDDNILIDQNDMFFKFQIICKSKEIECFRKMENLSLKYFLVRDKLVQYFESNRKQGFCYMFKFTKVIESYDIIPDFFVFRIGLKEYSNEFYIFPKEVFIEYGIIGTNNKKGYLSIGIPIPGCVNSKKLWISNYLNNYDVLLESI